MCLRPYSKRLKLSLSFFLIKRMCQFPSGTYNKTWCFDTFGWFNTITFWPKTVLFRNYSIEPIYIVDYFDYWKNFWNNNNKNKLLVWEILTLFFTKVIKAFCIYRIKAAIFKVSDHVKECILSDICFFPQVKACIFSVWTWSSKYEMFLLCHRCNGSTRAKSQWILYECKEK